MIYTAIDNFYLTDEQLQNSPSRKDGIEEATETTLRIYGCDLIQESGILLKLYPLLLMFKFCYDVSCHENGLFIYLFFLQSPSCDGHWSSSVPSFLLQEVICPIWCQG